MPFDRPTLYNDDVDNKDDDDNKDKQMVKIVSAVQYVLASPPSRQITFDQPNTSLLMIMIEIGFWCRKIKIKDFPSNILKLSKIEMEAIPEFSVQFLKTFNWSDLSKIGVLPIWKDENAQEK